MQVDSTTYYCWMSLVLCALSLQLYAEMFLASTPPTIASLLIELQYYAERFLLANIIKST
jgi:hypothetical protein